MLFQRAETDGTLHPCEFLKDAYGGAFTTACIIVGAGPSLRDFPVEDIAKSPIPTFGVNFSGRDKDGNEPLIVPDFWTSYDPNPRFAPSIYLNPSITKFVHLGYRMDLVPDTSYKMCDCPGMYFIENEHRGYGDYLRWSATKVLNARDSFVQALDIAFHLGFRRLYTVGTDMRVRLSPAQLEFASGNGIEIRDERWKITSGDGKKEWWSDKLTSLCEALVEKKVAADRNELDKLFAECDREEQYSFSEEKPFRQACHTDEHYYWVIQQLRQARKSISQAGVQLVNCTPGSRLADYFPTADITDVLIDEVSSIGDPRHEKTFGRYQGKHEPPGHRFPHMIDQAPHDWNKTLAERNAAETVVPKRLNGQVENVPDMLKGVRERFEAFEKKANIPIQEVG